MNSPTWNKLSNHSKALSFVILNKVNSKTKRFFFDKEIVSTFGKRNNAFKAKQELIDNKVISPTTSSYKVGEISKEYIWNEPTESTSINLTNLNLQPFYAKSSILSKTLYSILKTMVNQYTGETIVSFSKISKYLNISKRTYNRLIKELIDNNEIEVIQHYRLNGEKVLVCLFYYEEENCKPEKVEVKVKTIDLNAFDGDDAKFFDDIEESNEIHQEVEECILC